MNKKLLTAGAILCCSVVGLSGCKKGKSERQLDLRNLYFSSWDGSDPYTDVIEKKFDVEIKPSSYDYNSWDTQVAGAVQGNNLGDVFHFDLESFNFGNSYKEWAEGGVIKALPDDLSKWPHVKNIIEKASNIERLKINGHIYGLPLIYNQNDTTKDFSSFTYVYRRDWLRDIDPNLVHEDDVYTWEEFLNIIDKFGELPEVVAGNDCAIGDVSWGFPSLTNFYKDSPHCYSVDGEGRVVNAFTTEGYKSGLVKTRELVGAGKYFDQVTNSQNTHAYDQFKGGHMGIYYENLSLSNYSTLRKDIKKNNSGTTEAKLNDRTAIMRVKGPDGKFHLEGSENWFSMTFFNADISDAKQEKILDILEYLLGEEGTNLAIYGKLNQDYFIDENGDVELIPDSWTKKIETGEYATKINGAKYLREMITLNNDTTEFDPFTDQSSYEIVKKWQNDMKAAREAGQLVTFQEPAYIKWLSTNLKDSNTSKLIKEGNDFAMNFCYGVAGFGSIDAYVGQFNTAKWSETIAEVNRAIGK